MALQHLTLDQIDEAQLQRLIDGKASETRDIEYKRDRYGDADKDYGEYLADISSFANTTGGDIIIGMTAKEGVPTGFAPLQIDPDAEILRLDNIARSGLQPRIFGLDIRGYQIATGGFALVVRISPKLQSAAPHRSQTAFMRGRRLGSTSRTSMSYERCSHVHLNWRNG